MLLVCRFENTTEMTQSNKCCDCCTLIGTICCVKIFKVQNIRFQDGRVESQKTNDILVMKFQVLQIFNRNCAEMFQRVKEIKAMTPKLTVIPGQKDELVNYVVNLIISPLPMSSIEEECEWIISRLRYRGNLKLVHSKKIAHCNFTVKK